MTKNVISVGVGLHATAKEPPMQFSVGDLQQEALDLFDRYYSGSEFCLDPDEATLARIDAQVEAAFAEVSPE